MQEGRGTRETEPPASDVADMMSCPMCQGRGRVPQGAPGMMRLMPVPPIAVMFMMLVLTLLGFIAGFLIGNEIED